MPSVCWKISEGNRDSGGEAFGSCDVEWENEISANFGTAGLLNS